MWRLSRLTFEFVAQSRNLIGEERKYLLKGRLPGDLTRASIETRLFAEGKENDLLTGDRTDIMVHADRFDASNFVDQ